MARLQPTVELIARFDGRPVATLASYGARLREAGLLPETQRGAGASHLDPEHAAALLIATLGTDSPSEGPEAVRVYRSLAARPTPGRASAPAMLAALAALPFGEAVATMIENGEIVGRELPEGGSLILAFKRPVPTAELHLRLGSETNLVGLWTPDMKKMIRGFYKAETTRDQDRVLVSSVTDKTLFALSECITADLTGEL